MVSWFFLLLSSFCLIWCSSSIFQDFLKCLVILSCLFIIKRESLKSVLEVVYMYIKLLDSYSLLQDVQILNLSFCWRIQKITKYISFISSNSVSLENSGHNIRSSSPTVQYVQFNSFLYFATVCILQYGSFLLRFPQGINLSFSFGKLVKWQLFVLLDWGEELGSQLLYLNCQ